MAYFVATFVAALACFETIGDRIIRLPADIGCGGLEDVVTKSLRNTVRVALLVALLIANVAFYATPSADNGCEECYASAGQAAYCEAHSSGRIRGCKGKDNNSCTGWHCGEPDGEETDFDAVEPY